MLIGPPNVGKTTVLREMARLLAEDRTRVVAVVDKSLEIAGSGDVPHSSVGNARVLQVDEPANQASVMIEAVENQSPDVVIVDEISSKRQAEAARTIVRRLSVASAIVCQTHVFVSFVSLPLPCVSVATESAWGAAHCDGPWRGFSLDHHR